MSWINVKDKLPEEGKYVLAKHNRGTWHDSDDQENVNTVVVKLVRGISEKERKEMKGTSKDYQDSPAEDHGFYKISGLRSDTYKQGDEHGNNMVPWAWDTFGADSFFGQSITHWMPIPPLKYEEIINNVLDSEENQKHHESFMKDFEDTLMFGEILKEDAPDAEEVELRKAMEYSLRRNSISICQFMEILTIDNVEEAKKYLSNLLKPKKDECA